MTPREPWKPRVLRRFGRLLATAFALAYTALVMREVSGEFNARGAALVALLLYAVLSAFASWLSDRLGGAMLALASLVLASFVGVVAERNQLSAAALIGGPFLLAGLALLLAAGLHEEWLYGQEETGAEK
jgi:drug/metabolite transporter (DMT)-like permease